MKVCLNISNTHWVVNVQNGISRCPCVIPQTNCKNKKQEEIREAKQCSNTNHMGLRLIGLNKDYGTCACMLMGTKSILTSQVFIHHVRSMFYKEAEHGGATGPPLQPEQNRSFIPARLSVRAGHTQRGEISAPPSGDFTLLNKHKNHTLFG